MCFQTLLSVLTCTLAPSLGSVCVHIVLPASPDPLVCRLQCSASLDPVCHHDLPVIYWLDAFLSPTFQAGFSSLFLCFCWIILPSRPAFLLSAPLVSLHAFITIFVLTKMSSKSLLLDEWRLVIFGRLILTWFFMFLMLLCGNLHIRYYIVACFMFYQLYSFTWSIYNAHMCLVVVECPWENRCLPQELRVSGVSFMSLAVSNWQSDPYSLMV